MPGSAGGGGAEWRAAGETAVLPAVTRDLGLAPEEETSVRTGRHVVVVIGVDDYVAWPKLHNAVNDARRVERLFVERLGFEVLVPALLDGDGTEEAIQALVQDELPRLLRPDDHLVLFFAGHGHTRVSLVGDRQIESGYLIPVEASAGDHWSEYVKLESLLEDLGQVPARHVLVILDACRSGFAVGAAMQAQRASPHYEEVLTRRRSRKVITSARRDQNALDGGGPFEGNSLFTGTLLGGLEGGAADLDRNGVVTSSELGLYLQQAVGGASGSRQVPDYGAFSLDDRGELVIPLRGGPAAAGEGPDLAPPGGPGGRTRAEWELERAWFAWRTRGALPAREQLRYLAGALADANASSPQTLLLLRAAVARHLPARPWLDHLRQQGAGALVGRLEFDPEASAPAVRERSGGAPASALEAARTVLGLGLEQGADGTRGFGPVSGAAAGGRDAATRQTAALALTLLEGFDGPDRLRRAVDEVRGRLRRLARLGELLAALADARADLGPASGFARMRAGLALPEQVAVWGWRVRRRLLGDRRCWAALTVGGALGAGAAVAALRWAEFRLTSEPESGQFFSAFYTALPLGAALALGTALAVPLRAAPPDERGELPHICQAAGHDRRTAGLALLAGTLCFGLAHLLVALQNDLNWARHPHVGPLGLLAGLGLSLSLRGRPPLTARLGAVGWALRLGGGALTMVLTALLVTVLSGQTPAAPELHRLGQGVVLLLSPYYLSAVLNTPDLGPRGYYAVALLDAALIGALLLLGTTLGGALALRLAGPPPRTEPED